MTKKKKRLQDFEVDKLTNSIENAISGDSLPTDVLLLDRTDLKKVLKKEGWSFNWRSEHRMIDRNVYKLVIQNNSRIIQGLISLTIKSDHVYMNLLESAPFNRGNGKVYRGVPGNLVAFGCMLSSHQGFDGALSFHSKTRLIEHYEKTLGAVHLGGHLMVLNESSAKNLIDKYFSK